MSSQKALTFGYPVKTSYVGVGNGNDCHVFVIDLVADSNLDQWSV